MRRRDALHCLWAVPWATWLSACSRRDTGGDLVDASAILEVTPTGFLVVVTSARTSLVTIEIEVDGAVIRSLQLALEPGSNVGVADIDELVPDTSYTVVIDGSRTHAVRTAPADGSTRPVRLAVSADYDPSPDFANGVIDAVIASEPELYISIGDFPYTDNGPVAVSVEDYRRRHLDTRAAAPVRALHEAMGVRAIYDDHEVRNNWDAAFPAAEPERYAAAIQVWDEFFPVRSVEPDVRYRRWRWGANVECFLLDCRRFRSANAAPDDGSKTMLGAQQLAWFLAAIASSTATFKLIFSSVPLAYGTGNDSWPSFARERQR